MVQISVVYYRSQVILERYTTAVAQNVSKGKALSAERMKGRKREREEVKIAETEGMNQVNDELA